jgi:hypothetical protein
MAILSKLSKTTTTPSAKSKPLTKASAAEARRKRIACAVATSGKSITQMAREENISRGYASVLANCPQSRLEIAQLLDAYHPVAVQLLEGAFGVIAEGFEAEKKVKVQNTKTVLRPQARTTTRTSQVLTLGPEHFVRLTAVKRLIELLLAGRPVPKHVPAEESSGVSLEELTRWANRYWASKGENPGARDLPLYASTTSSDSARQRHARDRDTPVKHGFD